MPKWEARVLLGPKFDPAGAELVSNFFWLKRFETRKKTPEFRQSSGAWENWESSSLIRDLPSISCSKHIQAINTCEQRKKKDIIIHARLTVGQNWWNCWSFLSLYKDPVMLPRSAGAWVICRLRLLCLVFHSGIIVLPLFTWILFHPFLHTVFPFQLAVPAAHTRSPSWLCTKKSRLL